MSLKKISYDIAENQKYCQSACMSSPVTVSQGVLKTSASSDSKVPYHFQNFWEMIIKSFRIPCFAPLTVSCVYDGPGIKPSKGEPGLDDLGAHMGKFCNYTFIFENLLIHV